MASVTNANRALRSLSQANKRHYGFFLHAEVLYELHWWQ